MTSPATQPLQNSVQNGAHLKSGAPSNKRVCAVVVTFQRPQLLRRCLRALQSQMGDNDLILVVNNASEDNTSQVLADEFPDLQVLNLPHNIGGAGGFHEGMKWAFAQGYNWFWLMDDDGHAAPDCLSLLLENAAQAQVLVPIQQHNEQLYGVTVWNRERRDITAQIVEKGEVVCGKFLFAFVGPLISREVVAKIGLPNREFFIWFDDYDYALRLHRAPGLKIVAVPQARFFHDIFGEMRQVKFLGRTSQRATQAAWKNYYGTRNTIYSLRKMHRTRHLRKYLQIQLQHLIGDLMYEPDRWLRARLRCKAVFDGFAGKLGKRI